MSAAGLEPDEVADVTPQQWRDAVTAAIASGCRWLSLITAWDASCESATRGAGRRGARGRADARPEMVVCCRLLDREAGRAIRLETRIPWDERDGYRLPSVRDLVAGAAWYEREIADQFGITVDGADPRPPVIHPGRSATPAAPMRRSVELPGRAGGPPGGRERGRRR
ncbi:NADH-quinone oxidoreductase subunit C [Acidipropionibacterium virtanenii]|uniref:NAD(P)H-quinone oxidoreductase subunit J, chloroplastic n=1 Tax=Acidipropionibacterium virtanenii TaxID=2057246 RepID=A0A344US44_9ACTN|nr:NADH-quinone oxidoreductase subunit C [Acidipropionibacterium virtanenii]AXE38092.1 NAD(P)H-quinone oxidoreductase subunit J, chloroplastic [Acidipropionibacterium virtanenii]